MDVLSQRFSPREVAERGQAIRETMLRLSPWCGRADFDRIGADDLERLFGLYDHHFFDGWLGRKVRERGLPLRFRLSPTMTRAGGKTIIYGRRGQPGGWFEIAIASRMLSMNFRDVPRPVTVCGLTCGDRLEALQRLMEHEMIHLVELLVWDRTSCARERFRALARDLFGHTAHTHDLVTPREHAAATHALGVGDTVAFEHGGRRYVGRINRVHRRATVLVADPDGQPYTDGARYRKFYVPMDRLSPAGP